MSPAYPVSCLRHQGLHFVTGHFNLHPLGLSCKPARLSHLLGTTAPPGPFSGCCQLPLLLFTFLASVLYNLPYPPLPICLTPGFLYFYLCSFPFSHVSWGGWAQPAYYSRFAGQLLRLHSVLMPADCEDVCIGEAARTPPVSADHRACRAFAALVGSQPLRDEMA